MPLGTSLPARLAESAGTNYYVNSDIGSDANDGTANDAGHAWDTVQHAVDVVAAGSIINIAACTAEKLRIQRNMASTVTVQGLASFRPKLHNVWIDENGATPCRRWRLRQLEFDGSATAVGGDGFATYAASVKPNGTATVELIEFYDCWSHDHHVVASGSNSVNDFFVGGSGAAASNMTNIHFYNCVACNPGVEIYAVGNQTTSATLNVTNVDPYSPDVDPSLYFKASGSVFVYNTNGDLQKITYTGQATGPDRFTGCGGWTGTIGDGAVITDTNRNEDHGWYVSDTGNVNDPDVLIANCIAYDIRSGFGYQIYPDSNNVWVVNSLGYGNLARSGLMLGQETTNHLVDTHFKNCMSVRTDKDGNTPGFHERLMSLGASPTNSWDYCLSYNNPGGDFAADVGGALTSSNKITGSDPLFTNITNPHAVVPPSSTQRLPDTRNFRPTAGSPAYNAGDPAYTPTFDITGATRTTPDIGPFIVGEAAGTRHWVWRF